MKTAMVVAGIAIVLLICIPLVVGAMLPIKHTVSHSQTFDRTPEQLWPYVLAEYERSNDGSYRIAVQHAPSELVTEVAHPRFFGGTWTYTLAPSNSGTRLTVVERGEVYNPLFRFLSKFVFGQDGTLKQYFAKLNATLTT